jgi:WhiB family redox-sensing transcriptional regulator
VNPIPQPRQRDWIQRANCIGHDPAIFFPLTKEGKDAKSGRATKAARKICDKCPVMLECLRLGIDLKRKIHANGSMPGIWGGKTI